MNGKKYLLDTNAVIFLLSQSKKVNSESEFYVSFITELELLSYKMLSDEDEAVILNFLKKINVINIDLYIKERTIFIRKKFGFKLPDSIILATASVNNLEFITNDKELFKMSDLKINQFNCLFE